MRFTAARRLPRHAFVRCLERLQFTRERLTREGSDGAFIEAARIDVSTVRTDRDSRQPAEQIGPRRAAANLLTGYASVFPAKLMERTQTGATRFAGELDHGAFVVGVCVDVLSIGADRQIFRAREGDSFGAADNAIADT